MKEKSLKIYKNSFFENAAYFLRNYEMPESIKKQIENTRFNALDKFADRIVACSEKVQNEDSGFLYSFKMEPTTVNELKDYLTKNKDFVLEHIVFNTEFIPTHLYQLYLEYIPYKLTEIERSILLDGYIKIVTDLRGKNIANQKRLKLEDKLHLNVD